METASNRTAERAHAPVRRADRLQCEPFPFAPSRISTAAGDPGPPGLAGPPIPLYLERKQEQERNEEREDSERFRHRKAEDQPAELPIHGRRIAQPALRKWPNSTPTPMPAAPVPMAAN